MNKYGLLILIAQSACYFMLIHTYGIKALIIGFIICLLTMLMCYIETHDKGSDSIGNR